MKELTLDIASMVFMGHEPGTDHELVTKVNRAFTITTRAGNAIIRTSVPPFTWWRGLKAREYLENYFEERVKERRGKDGTDLLTVLCQSEDEDGNKFSDEDIVNHMIFLMMAAHDTSTSTATTMAYYLAANPEWQDRCRDESDRLGDGPLDIEALEKLETLDLVMNESIRLVSPVQWAMRQTVRDTELLGYYLPKGTNVIGYPGMNHRLAEIYPDPYKFDPDALRRAPQRAQEAPLRVHARSAAVRTSASAWCSASSRSRRSCTGCCAGTASSCPGPAMSRATTTAACRCRWTACRSCCGPLALATRSGRQTDRFAQAMTARNADCVASSARPIAHSSCAPSLPRMNVAVSPPAGHLVERGHLDGDAVFVEHRRESSDGTRRRRRGGADPVADRQGGLVVAGLRAQPGRRAFLVSACPLAQPQRARRGRVRGVERVPVRSSHRPPCAGRGATVR